MGIWVGGGGAGGRVAFAAGTGVSVSAGCSTAVSVGSSVSVGNGVSVSDGVSVAEVRGVNVGRGVRVGVSVGLLKAPIGSDPQAVTLTRIAASKRRTEANLFKRASS